MSLLVCWFCLADFLRFGCSGFGFLVVVFRFYGAWVCLVCWFLGFPFAVVSVVWVLLLFGLVAVGVVCGGFLGGGCVCVCVGVRGLVVLKFDVFW